MPSFRPSFVVVRVLPVHTVRTRSRVLITAEIYSEYKVPLQALNLLLFAIVPAFSIRAVISDIYH